jgi:heme-degrading monooxygenase HmoA
MRQNQQTSTKTYVGLATTPEPPMVFTSQRTEGDHCYEAMAQAMFELALKQSGCRAPKASATSAGSVTVAYFTDELAIHAWKQNSGHLVAQRLGEERWYSHYELRVAKVERAYSGPRSLPSS